ncbi:hypothetical protein ACFMQL_06020 [Nonomuraea fastidiosa]|jgi:diadenosine tetraphosphate (Ap4A) HIT family hydrolase|uniref:hypothetical protein n=1 Tax=Nonomuraea TaxID=83681 RepID=UPI0032531337
MTDPIKRVPFDVESYQRRSRTGPCFICGIVSRDPSQPEEIIYEDDEHIAFLARFAALPPGVPYERQQYHALMAENGVVEHTPEEAAALAAKIRKALPS